MGLYTRSGVSVETWVELDRKVSMRFETCSENENATLHFGHGGEYTLTLGRDNLGQLVDLASQAIAELDSTTGQE
ncbi:hypothetical protein [Actinokineospora pegani]|uniref:hypothetical protein n=1 Tax=Actinokineospora pegani TaxID=2654637 RepID=UPI0012EA6E95|nr:hypothetical protein [Actinokineospora pegani]